MLLNEESNKLTVGVSVEHEIFQDAMSGMTLVSSAAEERTFFRTTSLNLHYYLSSRLSVNAVVPYKNITSPKTDLRTGIRFTRNYSGLGDVILHNRLLLNEPESDRNPRFWLGLGLKLPTGDSRPDWDWGFGNSHDPVLQPGTGSLDQIFSTDYLQNLGGIRLFGSALYRLSGGENIHDYKFGNEFQYTLGTAYQPFKNVQISSQINGIYTGHDYDKSVNVTNTGGKWIYLTTGVKFGHTEFAYQADAHIPVYRRINNSQLIANYVFSLRMWYAFNGSNSTRTLTATTRLEDGATPDIKTISLGDVIELEEYLVPNKVTLFEFYSDTCLSCEALTPMLHDLVRSRSDVALRKINIGQKGSPILQRHNVTATPEVRIFNLRKQLVGTVVGPEIDLIQLAVVKALNQ